MMNLSDLLDKSFGTQKQATETQKQRVKNEYRTQRGMYFSKDECKDLIISLNYAINSIKNKKDVVEKKENSTRYEFFQRWSKIREHIKEKM